MESATARKRGTTSPLLSRGVYPSRGDDEVYNSGKTGYNGPVTVKNLERRVQHCSTS